MRIDTCMDASHTRVVSMNPKHTPPRSIRVADELWEAAKTKAAGEGKTVTDVIIRALERYVARK